MSYIVLARKWRPMKFEDVVGQEHVSRTLMNALEQNRLGHAFIFSGPRGVGKTTTARLLAKAVNCEKQPAVNPCNECETCTSVTGGKNLDVIEIDGASNRGIDEIRNLRENIRFAPAAARYKIYIIDEVHMLSKDAFNALLKTLEEPPPHAIFIFATTEIHRVPLTILSRCQRYDFKRIPTAVISNTLEAISKNENIAIDQESLLLIARKADGSMRDATSILDQITSFAKEKLTVEDVRESLGIIAEELYFELTGLISEKDDGKIILYAQKIVQQGHDIMNYIHGLEEHLRNILVTRAVGDTKLLETSDYYKEKYQERSSLFNSKDLLQYINILSQNEQLIKFSENPQLMLELLLLKLAHKPLSVDLDELLSLLRNLPGDAGSGGGKGGPSPTPPAPPVKPSSPQPEKTPVKTQPAAPTQASPFPGNFPTKEHKEAAPGDPFSALSSIKFPARAPKKGARAAEAIVTETPVAASNVTTARVAPEPVPMPPTPPAPAMKGIPAPPEPIEAAEAVSAETDSPELVSEEPAAATQAPPAGISLEEISEKWTEIVAAVKKEKIALSSFLQDGVPYKLNGSTLQIAFDPKTGFHMDHVQKNAPLIEMVLKNMLQVPLTTECLKVDFSSEGIKKQVQTPEEIFENMKDKEPVLKKIIDLFDCENLEE